MFRKQLKKNSIMNRTFEYAKGDITLKFTLRVDIKSQLKDFKELLLEAVKDVQDEIENNIEKEETEIL